MLDRSRMPRADVSDPTWSAVRRFLDPPASPAPGSQERAALAALDEIEASREPLAAVLIAPGIPDCSATVAARALAVQTCLLEQGAPLALPTLVWCGEEIIWRATHAPDTRWNAVTPQAVSRLAKMRPDCAGFLVIASAHRSGWVREAAVRGLHGLTHPIILAALPAVLNDWVEPIRSAARQVLEPFLAPAHAPALVMHLDQLLALEDRSRDDHRPILARLVQVLCDPASRPALAVGARSQVAAIRRRCTTLLLETEPTLDRIEEALASPDPWVQGRAAAMVRRLPAAIDASRPIERLLSSRSSAVRMQGIEALAERAGAAAQVRLRPFLLDRAPMVREFARFYIAKHEPGFNAGAFYRDQVADDATLASALAGVAEHGNAGDAPLAARWVGHSRAKVRLAAMRALAKLAPAETSAPFEAGLSDHNAKVRAACAAALEARIPMVPVARLLAASPSDTAGHRMTTVRLLSRYPAAEHLPTLMPFTADQDDEVAAVATAAMRQALTALVDPFRGAADPWARWMRERETMIPSPWRERIGTHLDQLLRCGR